MRGLKSVAAVMTVILLLPVIAGASGEGKLVRYPALSPDGKMISFTFQGDIWTANIDGSNARRLTIHEAYESHSRWSPDGKYIAFSSDRFGNNDIFAIPSGGGIAKRLTYHSAADGLTDWNGSSGILFSTMRTWRQIEWEREIHSTSLEGGTPERYLDALGGMAVDSPDGRFTAFVKGACRIQREKYTGPAVMQVWLYDHKDSRYILVSKSDVQEIYPRWADSGTLYYLSAKPGVYNVFSVKIAGDGAVSDPVQVTDLKEDGIRYFDVSGQAGLIVAEYRTGLYRIDAANGRAEKIDFDFGADYRFDPTEHKTYTGDITHYSVSPDGKYSAVSIHGEIFITENHKKKSRTVNISQSPWRDVDPAWTSDTTLVFLSDREGQYDLYLARSTDKENPDLFETLKREVIRVTTTDVDELDLSVSPDGKMVTLLRGMGRFLVAEITPDGKLKGEKILRDGWATPRGVAWSPDSKYIAYSYEDLNFNPEIYIHAVDGSGEPVNVSMHPRNDFNPVWSPDGSKLGFTSDRNNQNSDVWFVWLTIADWEKTAQDWEEEDDSDELLMDGGAGYVDGSALSTAFDSRRVDGKKDKKKEKSDKGEDDAKKEKEVEPVKIDFEDIHERLVQVTSFPGDEGSIEVSKDGKTFYFTAPGSSGKGRDLFSIKWDGKDLKEITKGGQNPAGLEFDKARANLYMLKGGRLARMTKGDKVENVALSANLTVDYRAEMEQVFEEAWRVLDMGFYDPDFHGQDWDLLKKKYKPWAMMASTKHDFREMFNILAGQLNASHMGMYGGDRSRTQREITGLLGIEIEPVKSGVKVVRVIPGSPAARTVSTLSAGEIITAVDGVTCGGVVNFYSLLINKAGTKVLLSVKSGKDEMREVAIRPVDTLRNELYDEWVRGRREFTEKASKGRLGYLHIQAMGWQSFERFEREFTAAGSGKDGIVIDVRYNGGGWTTDYLMAVLNIKQHAYTVPRGSAKNLEKEHKKFADHYPYAERLPFYPWMKPSISICNEMSYSNAEIYSHAYKTLGIGTLVGMPTFGAVISTDGRRLMDGSLVRLPFRAWYVKATGENMEHGPAIPDIIVENGPECKAAGTDPQLSKAIEELLRQIDSGKQE